MQVCDLDFDMTKDLLIPVLVQGVLGPGASDFEADWLRVLSARGMFLSAPGKDTDAPTLPSPTSRMPPPPPPRQHFLFKYVGFRIALST